MPPDPCLQFDKPSGCGGVGPEDRPVNLHGSEPPGPSDHDRIPLLVPLQEGTRSDAELPANYDGKDNPIKGNCQYGDAVAITRVDASTTRNVYKQAGKVTITQNAVVSSDGKTMTITVTGTSPLGQAVNIVAVYDKQ